MPALNCPDVTYLCVILTEGSGAQYSDSDDTNLSNVRCVDITSSPPRKTCQPGKVDPLDKFNIFEVLKDVPLNFVCLSTSDPRVQSFADLSSLVFAQGNPVEVELDVHIRNDALPASGNDILAVTGTNANYKFELQFSDVDIGNGNIDTLLIPTVETTFSTSLADFLAAASTTNFAGMASVTIPMDDCLDVSFLCIILSTTGIGSSYIDSDPSQTSNADCENISTQKSCFPGLYVCAFLTIHNLESNTIFI